MARQLRIEYEGAFYHVTSRGNQREKIYWDDKDREEFKKILKRTKEIYGYLLHAHVLMNNHYHLLIETPYANIKQIMQNINTSYTVYVNRRHKRFGHLFQGRYKAFIVDKESYLLELGRYIHLNPVRAGAVRMPEDYEWSSYREYLQRDSEHGLTNTDGTLYSFSRKRAIAVKKYQEFVNASITGESPLKGAVGSILGDETFRDRVVKHLKGIPDKAEIPEIKKFETKHNIEDIVKAVAEYYGVKEGDLLKRKKTTERQRKIAMYLCKMLSGRKNIEVGREFGVTLQAITNAIRDIERRSDKDQKVNNEIILIKESVEE
ncbi:MAG TPA: hypothetical protein DHU69_08460 [Deltaproteobacteria bacterium]|nr:MAG: hypothetical protein A2056_00370 [Deltaproteobacteria bacterium GWA2_42_85]OGP28559.1 MAG: hypothetical protein A2067_07495 [Deltaproteobacteria bacterium GWB2_42_7]OGP40722.1 MAG: hypothetical protein A2090_05965 [Deltaproteobacteria bacterium GWD2_42_10]OGP47264.1 MAG: hypothetical protein A2022_09420 [Deltaproteobacteria bacterium GWF2_42_12]OGQ25168.1 MAG: hypothetical protein A3D29_06830 [Deltaproteobacteria bacterium RIFCSPHIGHO2_02_FULL_42_44]OGQ36183.1 MAG: hypothetical protein